MTLHYSITLWNDRRELDSGYSTEGKSLEEGSKAILDRHFPHRMSEYMVFDFFNKRIYKVKTEKARYRLEIKTV